MVTAVGLRRPEPAATAADGGPHRLTTAASTSPVCCPSPATAGSATLALHRALLAPWLPPEPEETTGAELAARAGVPENSELVDQLVEPCLVERLDEGRLRVRDPALLVAGLQVVQLGVPPERLIAAQVEVTEHVRAVAREYVQMFVETRWSDLLDAGTTDEAPPPSGTWERGCSRWPPRRCWPRCGRRWRPRCKRRWSGSSAGRRSRTAGSGGVRPAGGVVGGEVLGEALLAGVQSPVADDGADHKGDEQRGGDEEADRADEPEAVRGEDGGGTAHGSM